MKGGEKKPKLREMQKKFVDLYIKTGNATQSYIDAGYKATSRKVADANARRLLATDSIKFHLRPQLEKRDNDRIASQEEVLEFLTNVLRGQVTERIPVGVAPGVQELVENSPNIKDREKAAELLGKRYRLFTDRQEIEATVGVKVVDDL